ncbi:hypothetical protein JCM5353_007040 [Sporobolomyces roseus]
MFFCSQDHQKLIWSSHKRVYGSSPFEWPSLDQYEVSELLHLIKEPLYTLNEADPGNSPRESRLEKDVRLKAWTNLAETEADYVIRAEEASKASLNHSAVRQIVHLRLILFDLKNFELFWKIQGVIGSIISPDKCL